jgi:hypothetical protein
MSTNPHTVNDRSAQADGRPGSDERVATDGGSRRQAGVVLEDTVVIQRGLGVEDAVGTDACVGIDPAPRHQDTALADQNALGDAGAGMHDAGELQLRTEATDARYGLLSLVIVTDGDEHADEAEFLGQSRQVVLGSQHRRPVVTLSWLGVLVQEADDLPVTLLARRVGDDFGVAAGTEQEDASSRGRCG